MEFKKTAPFNSNNTIKQHIVRFTINQKPTSMKAGKIFTSVNLRAGIIVFAIASIVLSSCGSSHEVCPAYKGYKKHGKR
jgi:hypothetical protein